MRGLGHWKDLKNLTCDTRDLHDKPCKARLSHDNTFKHSALAKSWSQLKFCFAKPRGGDDFLYPIVNCLVHTSSRGTPGDNYESYV